LNGPLLTLVLPSSYLLLTLFLPSSYPLLTFFLPSACFHAVFATNKKIPAEARIFKNQKPKFMKPFAAVPERLQVF